MERLTGTVTLTVIHDRLIPPNITSLLKTILEKNGCLIKFYFPTTHHQSWAYCLLTTDFYQYLKRRQIFGPVNLSLSGRASSFLKSNWQSVLVYVYEQELTCIAFLIGNTLQIKGTVVLSTFLLGLSKWQQKCLLRTEQARKCFNILAIRVGREIVWILSPS